MEEKKYKTVEEACREGDSSINQRIKGDFVHRHVYGCVNELLDYVLKKSWEESDVPHSWDDVENIYIFRNHGAGLNHSDFQEGTKEEKDLAIKELQDLLRIKECEMDDCEISFTNSCDVLYEDLENLKSMLSNEKDEIERNIKEVESELEQLKKNHVETISKMEETISEITDEICELENLDSEMQEIFTWYAVSDFLARKLKDRGEPILDDSYWGRCCFGQAILLDGVITEICAEMEILEGQRYSWANSFEDKKNERILELENALRSAINELKEWNPDSEAAQELEEILKK